MNFLDAQNLVAYWVDDLKFGYFTQPQVKFFLNNAQFEVAKRLIQAGANYYLKCLQTSMVINQPCYSLPSDFLKVNRLEIVLGGVPPQEQKYRLSYMTNNTQDLTFYQTGRPENYVLKKSTFTLFPPPDNPYLMRLEYTYKVIPLIQDTETFDVPEVYQELVPLYAARDCLIKDNRDASLLNNKIALYEQMMDEDSQERNVDQPRSIVTTGMDYSGGDIF